MGTLLNFLLIGLIVSVAICGALTLMAVTQAYNVSTWLKNKWRSWYG